MKMWSNKTETENYFGSLQLNLIALRNVYRFQDNTLTFRLYLLLPNVKMGQICSEKYVIIIIRYPSVQFNIAYSEFWLRGSISCAQGNLHKRPQYNSELETASSAQMALIKKTNFKRLTSALFQHSWKMGLTIKETVKQVIKCWMFAFNYLILTIILVTIPISCLVLIHWYIFFLPGKAWVGECAYVCEQRGCVCIRKSTISHMLSLQWVCYERICEGVCVGCWGCKVGNEGRGRQLGCRMFLFNEVAGGTLVCCTFGFLFFYFSFLVVSRTVFCPLKSNS